MKHIPIKHYWVPLLCSLSALLPAISMAESVPETLIVPVPETIIKEVPVPVPANCDATHGEECVPQGPLEYVGGNTRLSIGLDTDLKARGEASHIFTETEDSTTGASAWVGIDPTAEDDTLDPTLTGIGAKINHHWVSKNADGTPTHVNKVFGALDQNSKRRRKASAGYGQENENLFWEGYGSKSFTDEFHIGFDEDGNEIVERAYDYGVGGRVGTTLEKQLIRVRGGVDYEWGQEYADNEERPTQLTASAGVEKFFQDSPHSVSLNVSTYKKEGGLDGSLDNTGTRANVNYRYDFGNNVFRSDEMYRRVRVELPGKPRPPKYKKELVKNTMEMEADNFFMRDRHVLTPKAKQRLDTIISRIRNTGHVGNIRITGNTCNLGTEQHNKQLSERRAAAVKQYFIGKGFQSNILLTRGLGEMNPKFPNTPETGHKNRRVDIEYVAEQKQFKEKLVDAGGPGEPIVTWKQELCPTPPIWVQRALHNPIAHKSTVDDYQTRVARAPVPEPTPEPEPEPTPPDDEEPKDDKPKDEEKPKKVNKAPIGKPDFLTTWKNEKNGLDISPAHLIQNDVDPDNDKITFVGIVQSPSNGSLIPNGNGFTYYPRHNFCGQDSFSYTITDGNGGTDTVTVYIDVLETNAKY